MYTCEKNGKTFRVKDKKAVKAYEAAGYAVAEVAEKKTTKNKAKAAETADASA